jgi:ribonuclease-3 family protein
VRELLAETNRPSGELHSASVKLVKAGAQAEAFKAIQPHLTEQEVSIYKRGRNAHVNSIPKNSTVSEYHSATGIETLFGYLHLSGNDKRAKELFALILENFREKL